MIVVFNKIRKPLAGLIGHVIGILGLSLLNYLYIKFMLTLFGRRD